MSDDNNPALREILGNIIQAYLKTLKDTANLIGIEAKLAAKSVVHIVILSAALQSLLLMSWICVCGLILVYLMTLQLGILYSLSIVTALNISIVIITFVALLKMKRNTTFAATRRQLQQIPENKDSLNEHSTGTDTKS